MVYTSQATLYLVPVAAALALATSIAAVPALALVAAWIAARVGAVAPVSSDRPSGGLLLVAGVAAAFVARALLGGLLDAAGVLVGVPLGFLAAVLIVIGGALLASRASRAALRAGLSRAPDAVPPGARVVFGLALAVCAWSLASTGLFVSAALARQTGGATLAPAAPPGALAVTPVLALEMIPGLLVWAVGRAAMIAGAVALLRARYAGTLAYTAGFVLVFAPDLSRLGVHLGSLATVALLSVQLAALLVAWRYVRPRASPAPRLDAA